MSVFNLQQLQPPDTAHRPPNTGDGNDFGCTFQALVNGVNNAGLVNFRNLLDGGDFSVNPFQRNVAGLATTNFLTTPINNATGYSADRFFGGATAASSIAMGKVATSAVAGFSQALSFGRAASDTHVTPIYLGQVLETADSIRLQGQYVTFSFWAQLQSSYSGGALNVAVSAATTGADDTAAHLIANSGNWPVAPNVISTTQVLTTSWQRYYFTGLVPSNATQLGVYVSYTPTGTAPANTNDSIQFLGFQLEVVQLPTSGGVPSATANVPPTNYEHRDVQVELEICQRYAWVIPEPASGVVVGAGMVSATNTEIFYLATPVQLRAAPAVTTAVGSFKSNSATGGVVAATGLTGNATHTPNAIGLTSTGTGTAGQGALLQGGGGAGYILASADY
jgi:hypothetical protein